MRAVEEWHVKFKPQYKLGDLLTIPELAETLRIKVRTVREWVARRTIPFTRLKRRIYFDAGVVEGILRGNAVLPFPSSPEPCGQGGQEQGGEN